LRALREMRALRKRKTQATQALVLAMIGCFDRPFLLAGACVRCVKRNDRLRQLRDLRLHNFVFCFRNFVAFIAFLAHFFILLAYFFLCKTLRAFEWKPGLRHILASLGTPLGQSR